MRVLFLSDIHNEESSLSNVLKKLNREQFDVIFIAGDFTCTPVTIVDDVLQIKIQHKLIKKYTTMLYEAFQKPVYYVLGNHECINAVYEDENIHHVGGKAINLGDFTLLGQDGSSTSVQYEKNSVNYLGGYPWGVSKMDILCSPNTPRAEMDESKFFLNSFISFKRGDLSYEELKTCFNNVQVLSSPQYENLNRLKTQKPLIILSHQGPASSLTTFYVNDKKPKLSASGSPALHQFYTENKQMIKRWFHGHTHYPLQSEDQNVCICGPTFKEKYYVREI
ncbi:Calcineurin-like_phosphoesterase superfamily domain-containing protein [Hexamita inflata]|uniref:Calcineurin-like phosphoesterase superfamily domain-containing protein n=1 Tax=Hexamita inflata TaxID=28002 RepID=A0AA86PSH7_9EUKA|nr:Calcineurin-like phosphoesterase superfamily domain-containing protein [Hexamita inflata]